MTYSNRSPWASVGLCHHFPGSGLSAWLMLCRFPGSGLLASHTAHLPDSEGLQNVSGPSSPHVALANISALVATLKVDGKSPPFLRILLAPNWSPWPENEQTIGASEIMLSACARARTGLVIIPKSTQFIMNNYNWGRRAAGDKYSDKLAYAWPVELAWSCREWREYVPNRPTPLSCVSSVTTNRNSSSSHDKSM